MIQKVSLSDLAICLGTTVDTLNEEFKTRFRSMDLSYTVLTNHEKEQEVLNALKYMDADSQIIGAPERVAAWENGWRENYDAFIESGDLDDIVPKFIRPGNIVRWRQQFIRPNNPNFELCFIKLLQYWVFHTYFKKCENIYEFGCGSGMNLVALSKLFPDKSLFGSDFVKSSSELINAIAEKHGFNLRGRLFDMTAPDYSFEILPDSAVLTFGAIEQLAGNYHAFIKYLLHQSPKICVFMEPVIELYDDNLMDYLAIKFHKQRGYSEGLLPLLLQMQDDKKIIIDESRRTYIGNNRMEGYSMIAWRPL